MLEHRRQHYLSLLGIENYVPTRLIAGAAPSVLLPDELLIDPSLLSDDSIQAQFVIADDNKNVAVSADSEAHIADVSIVNELAFANAAAIDRSVASPESPRALLEKEFLAQSTQQTKQKALVDTDHQTPEKIKQIADPVVADQSVNHADLTQVKFVFSVWRVIDILVLDTRKVREALPTDHLLQNILRSVGYSVAQLPASESLRWPLFNNKKFNNKQFNNKKNINETFNDENSTTEPISLSAEQYKDDIELASAMVRAYISAQHDKSPLKYLFLMGEETSKYTLGVAIDFEDCKGTVIQSKFLQDLQCLVMPSLYTMLQDPSTKRIAWNALCSMNMNTD
jgi:hypothetical protein